MQINFLGHPLISFIVALLLLVAVIVGWITHSIYITDREPIKPSTDPFVARVDKFFRPVLHPRNSKKMQYVFSALLLSAMVLLFGACNSAGEYADKQEDIKRTATLLMNPNTPSEKLMDAARSDEDRWKLAAAGHQNLPDEGFMLLAEDDSDKIKLMIAGRTDAPAEAIVLLTKDIDSEIADTARKNGALPPDYIEMQIMDVMN